MKYNYVFFDAGSIINGHNDKNNYYYICTEELRQLENVKVVSYPMDWLPKLFHKVWVGLNATRLPFMKILYPLYFKNDFKKSKTLCFIIYGYYIRPDYLRYLRIKYPDCKIVKIHRDLICNWRQKNPDFSDHDLESLFDLTLTYDLHEAQKYGIPHFMEIESKIEININNTLPMSDLFFAGHAKNRLPMLMKIYKAATEKGIKCDFFLTGVKKQDRVPYEGITYADKGMSYRDMLYRTVLSKCILEVNQSGAVGYTSRFLEAVIYNKKLLTNNTTIQESNFYKTEYIQCFYNVEEIDYDFITNNMGTIDYNYQNEFSPIHLIEQIEDLLNDRKSKRD